MKLNNISTGILIVCILAGIVTAATTISDTSISVDNLILGGQTIVAYTAALNTKLSGIETLADVTDATNVNIAGAVMESDIPDQSFTNLLENGNLESWSAGTAVAPDGWTYSSAGGSIARSTDEKMGDYSATITTLGATGFFCQTLNEVDYYKGKTLTFGCGVKCATIGKVQIKIDDNIDTSTSTYNSGTGWEFLKVSHTINAGATVVRVTVREVDGYTSYCDGAILVEGSVCPAFSSKPLIDDGIMLQAHTPSSASDYGATGQWCYDNDYIYVCNATDVWIRTSLTTW